MRQYWQTTTVGRRLVAQFWCIVHSFWSEKVLKDVRWVDRVRIIHFSCTSKGMILPLSFFNLPHSLTTHSLILSFLHPYWMSRSSTTSSLSLLSTLNTELFFVPPTMPAKRGRGKGTAKQGRAPMTPNGQLEKKLLGSNPEPGSVSVNNATDQVSWSPSSFGLLIVAVWRTRQCDRLRARCDQRS